jgi:hypothetical protein
MSDILSEDPTSNVAWVHHAYPAVLSEARRHDACAFNHILDGKHDINHYWNG